MTDRRENRQMRFLVQRVEKASVHSEGELLGEIGKGFVVLIGICEGDTTLIADKMLKKMMGLRIFADQEGKTNLSLDQVGGELLLVSQFTLYADCRKGYRPSFTRSGSPQSAEELFRYIAGRAAEIMPGVQCGSFGAHMKVSLINDGPFTVLLDSEELFAGVK